MLQMDRHLIFQRERLGFDSCTVRIPDTRGPQSLRPASAQRDYSTFQAKTDSLKVPHLNQRPVSKRTITTPLPVHVSPTVRRPITAGSRLTSSNRFHSSASSAIEPCRTYEPPLLGSSCSDSQRDLWKMSFLPHHQTHSGWSVFNAHPSTTRRDTFLTCGTTKTGLMIRPSSATLSTTVRSQSPSPAKRPCGSRTTVVEEVLQLRRAEKNL